MTNTDIVLDYILNNQGCTAEKVVRDITTLSRVTIFNALKSLKADKIVTPEKSFNRRDINLYINDQNPLSTVPGELNKLEKSYFELVDAVEDKLKVIINKQNRLGTADGKILIAFYMGEISRLLSECVKIAFLQCLFTWSPKLGNAEAKEKLFALVFSKVTNMHVQLLKREVKIFEAIGTENALPMAQMSLAGQYQFNPNELDEIRDGILKDVRTESKRVFDVAHELGRELHSIPFAEVRQPDVVKVRRKNKRKRNRSL